MSLRQKTLTGLSWSVVSQVGRQVITFTIGVILARLLSPEEFGLIAMVTIITGFASLFAELGFGAAIIQKKDINEYHLSSVFWLNIFSGLLLTLIFIVSSGMVAKFYGESILQPITAALSLNFLIGSTAIVQRSLYTKSIDFKSLSIIQISTSLASGCFAIYMAFTGFGVWSLVWKSLLNTFFEACLLWALSTWKPKLLFSWQYLKELISFSINLLGERSLNYWVRSVDDLLIGKVLGSSSLGIYTKAYSIMLFPLQNISNVITRVMFPSMSAIKEDKERVGRAFLKVTRVIALITFPLMIGCIVVADDLIIVLFGTDWIKMIPILRILCLVGLMQSVVTVVGSVFLSQGRADKQFRLGLIIKPVLITGIIIGLFWGIEGVAIGYACAVTFAQYMNIRWAGSLVGVTYFDMLKNLAPVMFWASVMGICVFIISFTVPVSWPGWLRLGFQVLSGLLVYWFGIHWTNIRAYNEVHNTIKMQIKNN